MGMSPNELRRKYGNVQYERALAESSSAGTMLAAFMSLATFGIWLMLGAAFFQALGASIVFGLSGFIFGFHLKLRDIKKEMDKKNNSPSQDTPHE